MTQPQKERILKQLLKAAGRDMFQLKLMIEHEVNGINADKDEPCSLDHTLFDKDYLAVQPPKVNPLNMKAMATVPVTSAAHSQVKAEPPKASPCLQKRK